MEKLGLLHTLVEGMQYVTSAMPNRMEGPPKFKNRMTMWSINPISSIYPKELKSRPWRYTNIPIFSKHYSQEPRCGINLKYTLTYECIKIPICGIYITMQYNSAWKKEGNPAICNNMNEPWEHYTKGNKSITIRQKLHDFTYMRDILVSHLIEWKTGMVVTMVRGGRTRVIINRHKISVK